MINPYILTMPENLTGRFPLLILMHGFASGKDFYPISYLAGELVKEGIGCLSFDFRGMTLLEMVAEAKAVFDYACSMQNVGSIAFLGHSLGGLVAGLLASELEGSGRSPRCVVLLAPAGSIKDDINDGRYLTVRFNPENPPEFIEVLSNKVSREFLLEAKSLPVYETSCRYKGKVCILHGDKDYIVPVSYSERYANLYPDCSLKVLPNEMHLLNRNPEQLRDIVAAFLKENLI